MDEISRSDNVRREPTSTADHKGFLNDLLNGEWCNEFFLQIKSASSVVSVMKKEIRREASNVSFASG